MIMEVKPGCQLTRPQQEMELAEALGLSIGRTYEFQRSECEHARRISEETQELWELIHNP